MSIYETPDGEHLGRVAWRIFHGVATLLASSCPHCSDAEEAVNFFHDVINVKLGKPIMYEDNYRKWLSIAKRKPFKEDDEALMDALKELLSYVNITISIFEIADEDYAVKELKRVKQFLLNLVDYFIKRPLLKEVEHDG